MDTLGLGAATLFAEKSPLVAAGFVDHAQEPGRTTPLLYELASIGHCLAREGVPRR